MQLRDIHYVLAAADEGSFSKAAVKVHVSQPALSQLIQRLEDELGVKLFVRKSNRVTLTPAGKIFYEDGKVILALSDRSFRSGILASRCGLWTRFPAIRRRFWCRARWIWLL